MFPQLQRRLARYGRLEKIFLCLVAAHTAAWLAAALTGWTLPGWDLLRFFAYILGLIVLIKLLRAGFRQMLWRVRNRMIVLFLFIGVVPLVLVAVLVGLAGYFATGQAAVYMANTGLDRRAVRLADTARGLLETWRAAGPSRSRQVLQPELRRASTSWRGLQGWLRYGDVVMVFPPGENIDTPQGLPGEFRGIARRQDRLWQVAHVTEEGLEAVMLAPLGEAELGSLTPGLGRISLVTMRRLSQGEANIGVTISVGTDRFALASTASAVESAVALPPAVNFLDRQVTWITLPFEPARWTPSEPSTPAVLRIQTRPSAVYRLLFGQEGLEAAGAVKVAFGAVGIVFLVVEMVSLVVGISLTRTLTRSVHDLYEGTQRVNQGDFSHRIQVKGGDQLAELSRSFNSMTASIERLVEESKERQRMESELAIAREVQEQLFPKEAPAMRGLEVVGVCNAARTVSGDYYDFVKMSEERLGLAIADVAGKGISGALLMASIQSALRTQLSAVGALGSGNGAVGRFPTAELVSQLNVQLYHNTSPEKYATFFFGVYDDRNGVLTYTNAGHLPPILLRDGEARRLEVNGMVVGAFPFARYEQSEVELLPNDLLVAFTDGVTEPENDFAEEFGEQRLVEILVRDWQRSPREIIEAVAAAVRQWTGKPELQDDMTMLVARRL